VISSRLQSLVSICHHRDCSRPHGGGAGPLTDGFIAIAADGSQGKMAAHQLPPAMAMKAPALNPHSPLPPGAFLNGVIPVPGVGIVSLASSSELGGPSIQLHRPQME
jgi:hypothetical protein